MRAIQVYGVAFATAILSLFLDNSCCADEKVSFEKIQPILKKYCAGCHSGEDPDGDFSLSSFDALLRGTPDGPVLVSGQPQQSRLLQLLTGDAEPAMPPEDEPQPSRADVELLRDWVAQGMSYDPSHAMLERSTNLDLPRAPQSEHFIGAMAWLESSLIEGRMGAIERRALVSPHKQQWRCAQFSGKVNAIRVSADRRKLVVSSGVSGVSGEIGIVDADSGELLQRFRGHSDSVYCAALSPDGKVLASGSYDKSILLWDVSTGKVLRELRGHNGAIYDLDFHPSGKCLATASADQTVKLWHVESGQRLDTLGQPEGEMYTVRFSPDGRMVLASGADRQIRQWQVLSLEQPAINPMRIARFAHEFDVLQLRFLSDEFLISTSSDQTVKIWTATDLRPLGTLGKLSEIPAGIATPDDWRPDNGNEVAVVGLGMKGERLDIKTAEVQAIASTNRKTADVQERDSASDSIVDRETSQFEEVEPNAAFSEAQVIDLPARVAGVIHATEGKEDIDLFRFNAEMGQEWIIEARAAGEEKKLDPKIDILDDQGQPVLRTRLQAVRESYFTFRGKDSDTSDDYRLHKWEDMELDEFIYAGGEVNRLWLYPRGPDSGFKVYPGFGKRYTFFGTTPITHALGDVTYIVRELRADKEPLPNGLPVFPIYYENDDDGLRRLGKDSRLYFSVPKSGQYFLRLRDARAFQGPDFDYELKIRAPHPDFSVAVSDASMTIPRGSGREWKVTATRLDGLNGPISIEINDLPAGFMATNPLIIEAGQETAVGTIFATQEAQLAEPAPVDGKAKASADSEASGEPDASASAVRLSLTARSRVGEREIEHQLDTYLTLKLADQPEKEVQIHLVDHATGEELSELKIAAGQTISARVLVERNGVRSRIGFGKEDSGRNLPHGAFVDNIGLNGLLITEEASAREFFITAAPKVSAGRRQFHLKADTPRNPTSKPVWLEVVP